MGQNIFFENGFSDEDATVLSLESEIAIAIAHYISARFPGNQVVAARNLRIGQNEVSSLLNGNIARFSLPKLIKIARRAGLRLYMDIGENAHGTSVSVVPTLAASPNLNSSSIEFLAEVFNYDASPDSVADGSKKNTQFNAVPH